MKARAWDAFMSDDCDRRWHHHHSSHAAHHPHLIDAPPSPPTATATGLAAYSTAPLNAWSGWRYRIPGGPVGGQYHGYIAADDMVDGMGWPAGHDEIFRPIDSRAGLGVYPWQPWDTQWNGIPLKEGETVSDFVYRGPAEIRPRPNANGGVNVVRAVQTERTAGYAVAPGNYKGIGAIPAPHFTFSHALPATARPITAPSTNGTIVPSPPVCPAWGCGHQFISPAGTEVPPNTVAQPAPPTSPSPAPVATTPGTSGCPAGEYRDAAGNCTADYTNPYSLYLPPDTSTPANTVAANTCPTGYTLSAITGNCLAPGQCDTGYTLDPTSGQCVVSIGLSTAGIGTWLGESTSIAGMSIPNVVLAGVGALFAIKMLRKR